MLLRRVLYLAVIILLAISPIVFGANQYKGFDWGWCTWYAATEFDKIAPSPGVNWHGNAKDWVKNAHENGWSTTTNPDNSNSCVLTGTLVVWGPSEAVPEGHVAIVIGNWENGNIIKEMNFPKFGVISQAFIPDTGNLDRGKGRYKAPFYGYIFPFRR